MDDVKTRILSISEDNAVKFHVSNILTKLGVHSRSGAVSLALKQNLDL